MPRMRGSGDLKVGYSPAERDLLSLIPRRGRVTTKELVAARYGGDPPMHAGIIVLTTMRSLARKVDINRESFRIKSSKRAGPKPISFWIEKAA